MGIKPPFIKGLIGAGVYVAALAECKDVGAIYALAGGFVLARAFSGLSVICIKKMSDGGNVNYVSKRQDKTVNLVLILLWIIAVFIYETSISPVYGTAVMGAGVLSFIYYYITAKKVFGGISGDLAGWYVVNSEILMAVFAAVATVL